MKRCAIGVGLILGVGFLLAVPCGTTTAVPDGAFLDALHERQGVDCIGCHDQESPPEGAEVENERCLECHGPMEDLVATTAPEKFPDRNPHQSHLGEIGCSVCHHGHRTSEVYCLGCHKNFDMTIPGSDL